MTNGNGSGSVAPAVVPEEFIINPFAGNINPGSTRGTKLFLEATEPIDDPTKRLTATAENQHTVVAYIQRNANRFHWGLIVTAINVTDDSGNLTAKSLLTSSQDIPLKSCILQA